MRVLFFNNDHGDVYSVGCQSTLDDCQIDKLKWLFGQADLLHETVVPGVFVGPRKEMITPWSTNAVEITQNMGIDTVARIELFHKQVDNKPVCDPMLQTVYRNLDQSIFTIETVPEEVKSIENIRAYNKNEGLALSEDEIVYLESLSKKIGRKLTDSEVFGFSQVNSEHCRHKIFNGTFIIDGREKKYSLFQLIKRTSTIHPNYIISAYKDNCSFVEGPEILQFSPDSQHQADYFTQRKIYTVLSLKAETHNFPTTVEPFNGAATGTGGEIRDRIAGGQSGIPLIGTAVYMTSYPRLNQEREWENKTTPREWLYQNPCDILIKASNGASDFGNKFGQPLICGSVLTFEYDTHDRMYGYDKVIMLAGGVGYADKSYAEKRKPEKGDKIIVMGGDNYRIGMGGGAVSSVATGEYGNTIELNAVQRSNPEMQKRVYNAIRALAESTDNPVISIHDHGAGGHLNCLSELVEETGGIIHMEKLPVGDPTLSAREIIGNESQERMGLIIKEKDVKLIQKISERERAPFYIVGETTGDKRFVFEDLKNNTKPIDISLDDMFGKPPKTIMNDAHQYTEFKEIGYDGWSVYWTVSQVLQLESVACKDWLTNKVDRSVTGRCAVQQTCGTIQLPLNDVAVVALDYQGKAGIATSIGHAPVPSLISATAGAKLSVAEALTNIIWAPLEHGIKGISLSANWMWPCKNPGEDARLYTAVEALSEFAIQLGINIPTGKDSLSMTQKYPDGKTVYAPGTVIISASAEVSDIKKVVSPNVQDIEETSLVFIDFSGSEPVCGGSSFSQVTGNLGNRTPEIPDTAYFIRCFELIQGLISECKILAGHDVSAGGLITTLLEMVFPEENLGMDVSLNDFDRDIFTTFFAENPGVIIQIRNETFPELEKSDVKIKKIGKVVPSGVLKIQKADDTYTFSIAEYRDIWFKTSYLLDKNQSGEELALKRFTNYAKQPLIFQFPDNFKGTYNQYDLNPERICKTGIKAAIIREKGVNGDREMAWSMYLAGLDVKDVHMTDLVSGEETLDDIHLIVFVGGFSNSDVLGSAKGWAGAFLYNRKAKDTLERYYARKDTLSLGICNGCQLMVELDLIYPQEPHKVKMHVNDSKKFESSFVTVDIPGNDSVMLNSLAGCRLGIWIAHGEGKFILSEQESEYLIPAKYSYSAYPGNPNGSDYNAAAVVSADGRHLAMMPHLERSTLPWQWAKYPDERNNHQVSPWIEAFVNAGKWISEQTLR